MPIVPVVVVGVDGSESSKHAQRWAAYQAEATGAELVAIIVWHLQPGRAFVTEDVPRANRRL